MRRDGSERQHVNAVDLCTALSALAEVLERAARREEAATVLRQAFVEYERKPVIPLARQVRERLRALEEAPA